MLHEPTPDLGPARLVENAKAARAIADVALYAAAVRSAAPEIAWVGLDYFSDIEGKAHASVLYDKPIASLPIDKDAFAAAAWRLEVAVLERYIEIDSLEDIFDREEWTLYFGDRLILLVTGALRTHCYLKVWTPLVLDPSAHARLEAEAAAARTELPARLPAEIRCSKLLW